MTHKKALVFGVSALLCAIGLFGISRVNAASVGLTSMFQNGEHAKYTIIDMDQESDNVTSYLPDVSTNDGTLLVYKRAGEQTLYYINVTAEEGDTIDGGLNQMGYVTLTSPGQYVLLLGDATNNTWWVVGGVAPAYY